MGWESNAVFQVLIITGAGKSGLFVYSPAPAAGNLVASITAANGTDPYGNHYVAGFGSYSSVNAAVLAQASVTFYSGSLAAGWTLQGSVGINATNDLTLLAGAAARVLVNSSFLVNNHPAQVVGGLTTDTEVVSASIASGVGLDVVNALSSTGTLARLTTAATANTFLSARVTGDAFVRWLLDTNSAGGARIRAGSGTAAQDTNFFRSAASLWASDYVAFAPTGATAETWNTPTLINGWTNAAIGTALQYRRVAAPDNCVQLIGRIVAPAGIVAGQNIINALPAAYQPTHVQAINCINTTGPKVCYLLMTTGGQIQFSANAVAGDTLDIPGGNLIALTA